MKRQKLAVIMLLVFSISLSSLIPASKSEAGQRVTTLDASTIEDSSYWYCPEGDVVTKDGKITFTESSEDYTKFISRLAMTANKNSEEFVIVGGSIKFNKMPSGQDFVLALGVQDIEPSLGDAENIEVKFQNKGGVKVSADAYDADGNRQVLSGMKNTGVAVGGKATFRVSITKDSILKVSINGKSVISAKIPVSGSGKIAFMQTGGCAVEISEISIKGYEYDRPENTNVSEDFEKGLDISKIHILNTYEHGGNLFKPGRVAVEEYDGNKMLMFANAAGYYFTTKYQYSNFEMSFDVPKMQLPEEMIYDDGSGYFYSFGILFGISNDANVTWDETEAADGIHFGRGGRVTSVKTQLLDKTSEAHPIASENKPFSVKLSVIDGKVTVGLKWMEEKQYETVGTYTLESGSPLGYIRFSIPVITNMAIDNLKITNLDENPNVIETEYQNGIETFEDAKYEEFERVYKDTTKKDTDKTNSNDILPGISWYWLLPVAAVIGAAIIGGSFGVVKIKEKRRKEAVNNEA